MNPTPPAFESRPADWSEDERIQLALQLFLQRERRYGYRSSAAQVLFDNLASYQPDWEDLPLPAGRTVAQGRIVYNSYFRQSSGTSTAISAGPSPGGSYGFPITQGGTGGVTSRKRSAPSDTLTPVIGRPLAPKQPSSFASEPSGRSSVTGHHPISPMVEPPPRLNEPRKKRGRPTKQEAEERRRQMDLRTQMRMQAQAAQAAQAAQSGGPYNPNFGPLGPPLQPFPPNIPPPISREGTPTGTNAPVLPPAVETPRKPSEEENNSGSGSSGKKRKTRPPKLSVSETDQPPPSFYPPPPGTQSATPYESPPYSGTQRGGHAGPTARHPAPTAGVVPPEQDLSRFDPSEEARSQNPRSRPWEVEERSGP